MTGDAPRVVLAVDPGRFKCGVAVCSAQGTLARAIVTLDALPAVVSEWQERFGVTEIVVGNRTGSGATMAAVQKAARVSVRTVEEAGTTLAARTRYFAEHPPRGWRRLLPLGMQTPPEPYDDYVAVLLAEAALAGSADQDGSRGGRSLP
jgi:hypothetical protein